MNSSASPGRKKPTSKPGFGEHDEEDAEQTEGVDQLLGVEEVWEQCEDGSEHRARVLIALAEGQIPGPERPSRTAHVATSVRDAMPSLARMFDTWTAAVRGEM